MRLSEIRGEEAIEVMADLLEPIGTLFTEDVINLFKTNAPKIKIAQAMLKTDPSAVIDMLAILNQQDRKTYNPNMFEITKSLVEFFNDPEVADLFFSQGQMTEGKLSGSATEDIQAGAQ